MQQQSKQDETNTIRKDNDAHNRLQGTHSSAVTFVFNSNDDHRLSPEPAHCQARLPMCSSNHAGNWFNASNRSICAYDWPLSWVRMKRCCLVRFLQFLPLIGILCRNITVAPGTCHMHGEHGMRQAVLMNCRIKVGR